MKKNREYSVVTLETADDEVVVHATEAASDGLGHTKWKTRK
jgi:hypothetical protein